MGRTTRTRTASAAAALTAAAVLLAGCGTWVPGRGTPVAAGAATTSPATTFGADEEPHSRPGADAQRGPVAQRDVGTCADAVLEHPHAHHAGPHPHCDTDRDTEAHAEAHAEAETETGNQPAAR